MIKASEIETWVINAVAEGAVKLRVKRAKPFGHPGKAIDTVPIGADFSATALLKNLELDADSRNVASAQFYLEALNDKGETVVENKVTIGAGVADEIRAQEMQTDLAAVVKAQTGFISQLVAQNQAFQDFTLKGLDLSLKSERELNAQLVARIIEQDKQMASVVEDTLEIARMQQEREQAKLESEEKRAMTAALVEKGVPLVGSIAAAYLKSGKLGQVAALISSLSPEQKLALMQVAKPEQRIILDAIFQEEEAPKHANGVAS